MKMDSSIFYADLFIVNYLTNSATKSSAILLTISGSGPYSDNWDVDLAYFFYSIILFNILLKDVS